VKEVQTVINALGNIQMSMQYYYYIFMFGYKISSN